MDEWELRRQQLDEAQQRGALLADVSTLTRNMEEVRGTIKDMSAVLNQISKEMVNRKDYDTLKTQVDDLSRWKWLIAVLGGAILAISQIWPRIVEIWKR